MSYFTGETQTTEQNTETAQNQQEADRDFLTELVETKGDKWKDPQELAKGYVNSQEHIQNLMNQIEEMKTDLAKQDYMKEVLSKLEERQSTPPTTGEGEPQNNGGTNKSEDQPTDVEKIKELVLETLTEKERTNTREQNLKEADRQLTQLFGTEAKAQMENKAKELGMSKESLESLAAESPSAFMTLIGHPPSKEKNAAPRAGLNSEATTHTGGSKRNFQYYQKMRKESPSLYYSGKVQQQMLDDRVSLGDAFYQ